MNLLCCLGKQKLYVPLCGLIQQLEVEEHPYSISVMAGYTSECGGKKKAATAKGIWITEDGAQSLIL